MTGAEKVVVETLEFPLQIVESVYIFILECNNNIYAFIFGLQFVMIGVNYSQFITKFMPVDQKEELAFHLFTVR